MLSTECMKAIVQMGESEEEKRDGTVSTIIIEIISSIAFYTIQRKRALMMIVVIRPTERERGKKKIVQEKRREREREGENII